MKIVDNKNINNINNNIKNIIIIVVAFYISIFQNKIDDFLGFLSFR